MIVNDLRKVYPTSELAKMSSAAIIDTARAWARLLVAIPVEKINAVYRQTVIGAKFPPGVADLSAAWGEIRDEEDRLERAERWRAADRWRNHATDGFPALPEGRGLGRTAFQLHRERGRAVVCRCPPRRGFEWPARLCPDGTHWQCAQRPSCGFHLAIEETLAAPGPFAPMPLQPRRAEGTGSAGIGPPAGIRPPSRYGAGLEQASLDANVDLDAMTDEQLALFTEFYRWWKAARTERLTPAKLTEAWGEFEGSRAGAEQ